MMAPRKAAAPTPAQSRRREETANRAEAMMKIERLVGTPERIKLTDLETVIRGLRQDYLACRDRGHSWPLDDDDVIWTISRYGNRGREQVCDRCTMVKHERLKWDGRVYQRWYTAPAGYYIVGQTDRRLGLKVQLVRREILRRKFGEAEIIPISEIKKQADQKKRGAKR